MANLVYFWMCSRLSETERAKTLLNGFKHEGSEGQKILERLTGCRNLTHVSLLKIAMFFAPLINMKVPRDYKRRKLLTLKWFTEVHAEISPFVGRVRITFEGDKKEVAEIALNDETLHNNEASHSDQNTEQPEEPVFGVYHFSPSDSPHGDDLDFLWDDSWCCEGDWAW